VSTGDEKRMSASPRSGLVGSIRTSNELAGQDSPSRQARASPFVSHWQLNVSFAENVCSEKGDCPRSSSAETRLARLSHRTRPHPSQRSAAVAEAISDRAGKVRIPVGMLVAPCSLAEFDETMRHRRKPVDARRNGNFPCSFGVRLLDSTRHDALMAEESLIAVFVDFENLALGVRDMKGGRFDISLILKRLLEKGRLVYKRAYCDWKNYRDEVREFHGQGIELIDIPQSRMSGKNSADIRMVVDALDLCYSKDHIDTFALISGDSDFSPLVSKLKENNKRVIGCGVKSSTSELLIGNCDEFIYYDDLAKVVAQRAKPKVATDSKKPSNPKEEARERVVEVLDSIEQDYDTVWGSLLKQIIRRVYPGFSEGYYGYGSFSELLEDVADAGMIELDFDPDRRNYQVSLPQKKVPRRRKIALRERSS
jgi:uncharacterized protein (TIGR00288 family)